LFLTYFLAAAQTMFPRAVNETTALVNAPTLPPLPVLAGSLANELDLIEQDFILVLDDIHHIQEKSVYDLIIELLRHPPRPMHLVLVGRLDPSLHITSLHARDQVTEVRLFDLRFNVQETAEFLTMALGEQVDKAKAAALAERSEGWVTGLRLAVLAMRGHADAVGDMLQLKGTTAHVMDYLITEVLNAQPPAIRRYLLRASILERVWAPLCDIFCVPDSEPGEGEIDGNEFIAMLQKDNRFQISLDTENRWFRYYHLFRHLLKNQLERPSSPEEIASLHSCASEWFETEGLIDEAFKYALAARDLERAAQIVEGNWRVFVNQGKWHVVSKWLSQVPDSVVLEQPGLLLAQIMKHYYRLEFVAIPPILDRIEDFMGGGGEMNKLSGEIELFRGYSLFLANEGGRSLKHLEHALTLIPVTDGSRGIAETLFGLAGQMEGQGRRVTRALTEWLNDPSLQHPLREIRLLQTLKFIHYLAGDPEGAERYLQRKREVAR
jgi:LuxR family maltose regulon positive regulatory protein